MKKNLLQNELKVAIASAGPFHAYDLARRMNLQGVLNRFYTSYPKFRLNELPRSKIKNYPWLMVPAVTFRRLGWWWLFDRLHWPVIDAFDRWVATNLENCDVFHHLSACGGPAQKAARDRFGALIVCDRGSSHILYQDEILAEEYARWGLPYQPIDRRFVERELEEYAESDFIAVPSEFVYRSFVKKGVSPQKLVKVPYGVDLKLFHQIPKKDNVFRVIFVGSLSLRKGIPDLLEAVAPLKLPNFELCLIGPALPEVRPFLSKYEDQYHWLGPINKAELYKHYSHGSVFVIASVEEGLALVQAQAMACGLPVIATTNTGCEDLFTSGVEGFIVPIRSPEAIREKILYLYEHPTIRDEMAQAALQRVKNLGGWDTYGEQMLSAYWHALKHRHP